jgi:glycosyl transferase family 25
VVVKLRNFSQVKIFVISLDRAVERRDHMNQLCQKLGLQVTFVSGVDGRTLTAEQRNRYSPALARRIYGCEMTDSEIGCYLSHYGVYERMTREAIDTALIIEDDISCVDDLKRIVEQLAPLRAGAWQVVRLQSTKRSVSDPATPRAFGESVGKVGDRDLCRLQNGILGGCAYMIRRPAAEAMLRYGRKIFMPIDQALDRYWENGIVPFVVRPLPVWHEDMFESNIGVRGRALASPSDTLAALRRRLQRLRDSFDKRIFWAAFERPLTACILSWIGMRSAQVALIACGIPPVFED